MKVLVIGASGFGSFHVREFIKLQVDKLAVVTSSASSAMITAQRLSEEYSFPVHHYANISDALTNPWDIVSIATPSAQHLECLQRLCATQSYVFCEKPMIQMAHATPQDLRQCLESLNGLRGRLCLNVLNAHYMRRAMALTEETINRFSFAFHTHGKHQHEDIGFDLLPHALACLQQLTQDATLSNIRATAEKNGFNCTFLCNHIQCEFSLAESSTLEKKLELSLNGKTFSRMSRSENRKYTPYLVSGHVEHPMCDPLETTISEFFESVKSQTEPEFGYDFSYTNTIMMNKIMESIYG